MLVELRFILEPELTATARKKVCRMIHRNMSFQCTCCWENIVTKVAGVVTGLCPLWCIVTDELPVHAEEAEDKVQVLVGLKKPVDHGLQWRYFVVVEVVLGCLQH